MKNKDASKVEADKHNLQAVLAGELGELALSLRKKDDFPSKLAAIVIYSNLIEYLLETLIASLYLEIRCVCLEKKSIISLAKDGFDVLNKEYSLSKKIEYLKLFDFPNKDQIIKLFDTLRPDRNDVIHKLIKAKSEGKNIDIAIKRIFNNIDPLIMLLNETGKTVMKNNSKN